PFVVQWLLYSLSHSLTHSHSTTSNPCHTCLANITTIITTNSSILTYTPHATQEFGQIECIAKNAIGIQRQSCKYLITQSAEPYFPFSCQVINQSDCTLTVNCAQQPTHHNRSHGGTGGATSAANSALNASLLTQLPVAHSQRVSTGSHNKVHGDNVFSASSSNKPINNNKHGANASVATTASPYMIVHPHTYYVCEVYDIGNNGGANQGFNTPGVGNPRLIKNVTVDAVRAQLMRHNSTFDFFIDQLPAKTQLKLRIYAVNIRNIRSHGDQELRTQTLLPAQRLIDFDGTDNNTADGDGSGGVGAAGVRIHGKHLIVGVLISAAAVAVIVVIMAIIAVFKVRYSSSSIHLAAIDAQALDREGDGGGDGCGSHMETMLGTGGGGGGGPGGGDCNDECSSDQTLLKCGNTALHDPDDECPDQYKCDQDLSYYHNGGGTGNGKAGPPDIIPVPYYGSHVATGAGGGPGCSPGGGNVYYGTNERDCCDSSVGDNKGTCSGDCFFTDHGAVPDNSGNYFAATEHYKMQDMYPTKGSRVYVYNKEVGNKVGHQLTTDYQNVLHVNLIPGNSKQQQQQQINNVANISL
ncbi:unnamed protein product, partial [Medioppia subpectinata]